jgi:hypothetical protein
VIHVLVQVVTVGAAHHAQACPSTFPASVSSDLDIYLFLTTLLHRYRACITGFDSIAKRPAIEHVTLHCVPATYIAAKQPTKQPMTRHHYQTMSELVNQHRRANQLLCAPGMVGGMVVLSPSVMMMMMILHQLRHGQQDNHATNLVKCA